MPLQAWRQHEMRFKQYELSELNTGSVSVFRYNRQSRLSFLSQSVGLATVCAALLEQLSTLFKPGRASGRSNWRA